MAPGGGRRDWGSEWSHCDLWSTASLLLWEGEPTTFDCSCPEQLRAQVSHTAAVGQEQGRTPRIPNVGAEITCLVEQDPFTRARVQKCVHCGNTKPPKYESQPRSLSRGKPQACFVFHPGDLVGARPCQAAAQLGLGSQRLTVSLHCAA